MAAAELGVHVCLLACVVRELQMEEGPSIVCFGEKDEGADGAGGGVYMWRLVIPEACKLPNSILQHCIFL